MAPQLPVSTPQLIPNKYSKGRAAALPTPLPTAARRILGENLSPSSLTPAMNSMLKKKTYIVLYRPEAMIWKETQKSLRFVPKLGWRKQSTHKQLERLGIIMSDVYRFSCMRMHLCACAKAGGRHQVSSSIVLNLFYFSFRFLLFYVYEHFACMHVCTTQRAQFFWGRVSHGSRSLIG